MNDAPRTPVAQVQAWQFGVEIDGFTQAYFTKATLPEVELDTAEFSPAGSMFNQKLPGRAAFADITLTMGTRSDTAEDEAFTWLTQTFNVLEQIGADPADFLRDIAIVQYSRPGVEFRRWVLHGAWVKKYAPGEQDGSSSDNVMRELTLSYQYYTQE